MNPEFIDDSEEARLAFALANYDERRRNGLPPLIAESTISELTAEEIDKFRDATIALENIRQAIAPYPPLPSSSSVSDGMLSTFFPRPFGRFEILREVGRGGFGVVFLAWDPGLHRDIALKVPMADVLFSETFRKSFEKEGKAAARLRHPNIVAVYETGEVGTTPYIASEFRNGPTLRQWIDGQVQPVPPKTAAEITLTLARAVEHAHSRGVLHRDLKPTNVLMTQGETTDSASYKDRHPIPVITDFGLARLEETSHGDTRSGALIGTVRYMAPEQAEGNNQQISRATDVYALGVILYEMLTGHTPFRAETDLALIHQIIQDQPIPPNRSRSNIPGALSTICLKCLAKRPSTRYVSAADLSDDLQRFLDDRPVLAKPIGHLEALTLWAYRRPSHAILVGTVFTAFLTIFAMSLWYNARLNQLVNETQAERDRAKESALIARDRELTTRRFAYASDMRIAHDAWDQPNLTLMRELLDRYLPSPGDTDLRGFLWWHLHNRDEASSVVVGHHDTRINAIAVSPKKGLVASGGSDGIIRIWNISERRLVREIKGHDGQSINDIKFNPDGDRLASAGEDGSIRVWLLDSGILAMPPLWHQGWASTVRYSADGKLLASGGADKLVRLWSADRGHQIGEFSGHGDTVRALAFHPTQPWLVSSGEDGLLLLRNHQSGQLIEPPPQGRLDTSGISWVRSLAFTPDGSQLWGSAWNNTLCAWNFHENEFGKQITRDQQSALSRQIDISPDSQLMASCLANSVLEVRQLANSGQSMNVIHRLVGHSDQVNTVSFLGGRDQLLSASNDGTLRLWNLKTIDHSRIELPPGKSFDFAISDRGTYFAFAHLGADVEVIRLSDQSRVMTIPSTHSVVSHLRFSPDEKRIYCSNFDFEILCSDLEHKSVIRNDRFKPRFTPTISRDGKRLAAVGNNAICIFDASTLEISKYIPQQFPVSGIEFVGNDELVVVDSQPVIRILDVTSGRQIRTIERGHQVGVHLLCVSSNDTKLATFGGKGDVRIWDYQRGKCLAEFTCREGIAQFGFLFGDESLVVTDRTSPLLHIYNLATMTKTCEIQSNRIAVTRTGNLLLNVVGHRATLIDATPRSSPVDK